MRNIIHRSRAELRRSFDSNLQPSPELDIFLRIAGPRASAFPARRQRCAKIKSAKNKHRSLSQTSVKCNRSLLCKGNRASSFRSKIRCDCSAPASSPLHHRLSFIHRKIHRYSAHYLVDVQHQINSRETRLQSAQTRFQQPQFLIK